MLRFKQFILEAQEHPMIDVDGVLRHRNNSEGHPIHETDEAIKNFYRWFGNSKSVDEYGRPKIVYHNTDEEWDEYDPSKEKESAVHGKGLYVAIDKPWNKKQKPMRLYVKTNSPFNGARPASEEEEKDYNEKFSKYLGRNHNIKENGIPFISMERRSGSVISGLREAGFDSFIHPGPGSHGNHMVIFDGKRQIKSAENNNGNYSSNTNKITE